MKLSALARGGQGERGLTLTELLVTTTIIGVLAAVVATGVGGSVTTGNESARGQLFDAVQKAVDGYASSHLPADGDLTKAEYPYERANAPFGNATALGTVVFTDATVASTTASAKETVARDWYGANGKFLSHQPGQTSSTNTTVLATFFVYVDLYSGGPDCSTITPSTTASKGTYATADADFVKTDLRCLGNVALPASGGRIFGTPRAPGNVIRCIFASHTDTLAVTDAKTGNTVTSFTSKGETSAAKAKGAVGANKGRLLACRDADPSGTSKT